MGTTLIESRQRGADVTKLTTPQRTFIAELLADDLFNPTRAAKKAGYKNPSQAANKLMKNPTVAKALGKAQREREERCQLKADDVLNYLRAALFFNPLHYFRPDVGGGWLIDDPSVLPEEVGRLIEKMEMKVVENEDGSRLHTFKVELVSKSTALSLAMKHTTLDAVDKEFLQRIDFDALQNAKIPDLIEAEIEKVNGQ